MASNETPSIEISEADSPDALLSEDRTDATQQAMLKNAVQSRYFALVGEGSSPNAAAASAIRDIGSSKATLLPGELLSSDSASDDCAPRHLRFEDNSSGGDPSPIPLSGDPSPIPPQGYEEFGSRMQLSSSAPILLTGAGGGGRESPQPIGGGRDSPPLNGHRNQHVWKTFGIHLPAGRLLKNLYGGGKVNPVPGTLKQRPPPEPRSGPPPEHVLMDTYMAVNNLNVGTPGLQYCKSMNIFDTCKGGQEFVRWGDSVEGYRLDASWLQVGDRYLPTVVNRIQVLKRWQGSEVLRAEGLRRQQSLPALKKLPRERSNAQLTVGGVAYGF